MKKIFFLKSFLKKYKLFISFWIIGSIIVLYLFNDALTPQKKLPIFQPAMVNYELVDSTLQFVKKFHKISNFKLINQNGKIITNRDYDNKIYLQNNDVLTVFDDQSFIELKKCLKVS